MVLTSVRFIFVQFELFKVDKPNEQKPNDFVRISDIVRNPNNLATEPKWKAPKSERSDFGRSL